MACAMRGLKHKKLAGGFESLVKPQEIEEGAVYDGVVTNVNNFGVFVNFGAVKDGATPHQCHVCSHACQIQEGCLPSRMPDAQCRVVFAVRMQVQSRVLPPVALPLLGCQCTRGNKFMHVSKHSYHCSYSAGGLLKSKDALLRVPIAVKRGYKKGAGLGSRGAAGAGAGAGASGLKACEG